MGSGGRQWAGRVVEADGGLVRVVEGDSGLVRVVEGGSGLGG